MAEPVTSQPVANVSPVTMSSEGSWSTGRYDFFADFPMCCVGFLCPSILATCITYKYGEHCFLWMVPGGLTALRTHMRLSYGIPGTLCQDALAMCICGWCELCRMGREMYTRSRSSQNEMAGNCKAAKMEMSNSG